MADDEATAKKVAFNEFSKHKCVTIKGDVYNPTGVLSGGYNESSKTLFRVHELKKFDENKNKLLEEQRKVIDQIHVLETICKFQNIY